MEKNRIYIAIDLKSFYASVECMERNLDPLTTNLVVADVSKTEKTICLAVSPSLKAYGIPGRARLFEVVQKVKQVNEIRKRQNRNQPFQRKSYDANELKDLHVEVDYIAATPQMAHYMQVSTQIYQIYLKYIAPEDIHVYSIDEVFMDVTNYLDTYQLSAHDLAMKMMKEVYEKTHITATAGIGTNLYLCKVAMDIVAKHMPADENGVRIAELDEMSYRRQLWTHEPLRDFWRVGKGYVERLRKLGITCMGEIAELSLSQEGEDVLYHEFGVNAELLIDHAWGYEPCLISDIKAYKPENNSISAGQVLTRPYQTEEAKLVVREMADALSLDLVRKKLITDQMVLTVGYDIENMKQKNGKVYQGELKQDFYGRILPKEAHGSKNIGTQTSSTELIVQTVMELFDEIVVPGLLVRRMYVVANHVVPEEQKREETPVQMDLFTDYEALEKEKQQEKIKREKERKRQEAILELQKRFGKNAVLKGSSLLDGATAKIRNEQIGGHKA